MEFNLITLATFEEVIGGFGEFVNQYLIPDPIMFLIQLCSTAVIFIVVALFFFKPVRELLKARQDYVENQIKESEEAKERFCPSCCSFHYSGCCHRTGFRLLHCRPRRCFSDFRAGSAKAWAQDFQRNLPVPMHSDHRLHSAWAQASVPA